jgi:hypothetical protein
MVLTAPCNFYLALTPLLDLYIERIRNTLSHEMCHLACWIINGDPKEGHGKVWKGWCVCLSIYLDVQLKDINRAAQVERKRTDIEVTVGVSQLVDE